MSVSLSLEVTRGSSFVCIVLSRRTNSSRNDIAQLLLDTAIDWMIHLRGEQQGSLQKHH